MSAEPTFESWCIVEIMGHARYAGFVTEQPVGGCSFVRIDVPELPEENGYDRRPAFTKLFGQGSIFAITPCTEQTAREAARSFRARALSMFEMPFSAARQLPGPTDDATDSDPELNFDDED